MTNNYYLITGFAFFFTLFQIKVEAQPLVFTDQAREHLQSRCMNSGYSKADLADMVLTHHAKSEVSGLNHYYFVQQLNGIPVRNGLASVHINSEGLPVHIQNNFVKGAAKKRPSVQYEIDKTESVSLAQQALLKADARHDKLLFDPEISVYPSRLTYQSEKDSLFLVWEVELETRDGYSWLVLVDAHDGAIRGKQLRTATCRFDHAEDHEPLLTPNPPPALSTFINEINYLASNPQDRFIEILGNAGQSLLGWSLVYYHVDGTVKSVENLSGVIPLMSNDQGIVIYDVDQGTGNEGVALVNSSGEVVQFVSFGASGVESVVVNAVTGPAAGLVSSFIGSQYDEEHSLQLTGSGLVYEDFEWTNNYLATPNEFNVLQLLGDVIETLLGGILNPPGGSGSDSYIGGQYNIVPPPYESPMHGGRSLMSANQLVDQQASPLGWHATPGSWFGNKTYSYTKGNNVYAYYDQLGLASDPVASRITKLGPFYLGGNVPWPSRRQFKYDNNITGYSGIRFIEDAITNAFVWTNLAHDVFYRYGFDEAAGNFQAANLTGKGKGDDYLLVEVQDGSGKNNARFNAKPEGEKSTMRLFLWNSGPLKENRDASFDNLIVIHEYAHGLTARLVGGPDNVDCFNNYEHGSEGWSDFFGMMFTLRDVNQNGAIDKDVRGEGLRTIGNYVLGEDEHGDGLRPAPYTYNMDCERGECNDFTYADMGHLPSPHGTGFLWGSMLWDMALNLIDTYGFEPDLRNSSSGAGNIRAMKIVVEALKLTPCNPGFIEMRDAILLANDFIYGGEGEYQIWEAFARRGLGAGARSGGKAAFDNPTLIVSKSVDKTEVASGESFTYTIKVTNNSDHPLTGLKITDAIQRDFIVTNISGGGAMKKGVVHFPQIPKLNPGATVTRTISGIAYPEHGTNVVSNNEIESPLPANFLPLGLWVVDGGNPNPATGSIRSWWHADAALPTDASLQLSLDLDAAHNNHLSFWHDYDLEPSKDGAVVEILHDGEWRDLGSKIIRNGYNQFIYDVLFTPISVPLKLSALSGRRAFSGASKGYVNTIIDLSEYSGEVKIRFRLVTNIGNENVEACDPDTRGCDGWYIDDVQLLNLSNYTNTVCVQSDEGLFECDDVGAMGTLVKNDGNRSLLDNNANKDNLRQPAGERAVEVYPNPNQGDFTLSLPKGSQISQVHLYSASGRLMRTFSLDPEQQQHALDCSDLPKGFYYLKTKDNRQSKGLKVVIH